MKKDSYLLDILEREILIMKSFDHPGYVRRCRESTKQMEYSIHFFSLTKLLEAYQDDKSIYLVMDYVGGGELFVVAGHQ